MSEWRMFYLKKAELLLQYYEKKQNILIFSKKELSLRAWIT